LPHRDPQTPGSPPNQSPGAPSAHAIPDPKYLGQLTRYAAMMGDAFAQRLHQLTQLLGTAHPPSIGMYKENLLRHFLSNSLPKRYSAATGFVLFPGIQSCPIADDAWPRTVSVPTHELSRQIDILVYNSADFPTLFEDEGFVVVTPQSVRAVIEVKGSLDHKETTRTVEAFVDYARKWKECRAHYVASFLPAFRAPTMILMAWNVATDRNGRPRTDGRRLRERIVAAYRQAVPDKGDLPYLPLLQRAFIYGDCMVQATAYSGHAGNLSFGYATDRGQFVTLDGDGTPTPCGDKTVASLLTDVRANLVDVPFDSRIEYVDQDGSCSGVCPHPHEGFTPWLRGDRDTRTVLWPGDWDYADEDLAASPS